MTPSSVRNGRDSVWKSVSYLEGIKRYPKYGVFIKVGLKIMPFMMRLLFFLVGRVLKTLREGGEMIRVLFKGEVESGKSAKEKDNEKTEEEGSRE